MAAKPQVDRAGARIRAFGAADAAAAREILRGSPEAAQWTELGFKELLGWPGVLALVSEKEGKITGFFVARQVGEEAEILNLAVHLLKRRIGEGQRLLKAAMEEFRVRGITRVFLEVRDSNVSGIAFYTKHGFARKGRRAGYYRHPDEAAVLMERKLEH
ncbi:MAG TPA: ribosomal protein S18-alanine N-acetyltransferase [Candidatus Cybelea sp.]|nr:ribosomal protein S18-alanine N-acetyltransferase [Candidatus Cybelea sp.]